MTTPHPSTRLDAALSDPARVAIGRVFAAVAIILGSAGMIGLVVFGGWDFLIESLALNFGALAVMLGVLTWLMIPSQSHNGSVWALAWAAVFAALFTFGLGVAVFSTLSLSPNLAFADFERLSPAELPVVASMAVSFRFWPVVPAFWLPLTLGLLLFPDGRPPSPRWRWVGWWSIIAITVATVATAVAQNPWSTLPIGSANETVPGVLGSINDVGFLLASMSAVASVASLVVRYRRSSGIGRSQIRWIAVGGTIYALALVIAPNLPVPPVVDAIGGLAAQSALVLAYGIAITKYRLYDIDVVISKSVTYLGLAAAITVLYAAVVVVPIVVIGESDAGGPGLLLPIVATAVVAVLFEPIRSRMQRGANRLVYGKRATPHDVLSQVTANLSAVETGNGSENLARLVAQGTGAERAVVWLVADDLLQPEGTWSVNQRSEAIEPVPSDGLEEDELRASSHVRHGEEVLGAVSITKPRNDPITPADRELLADAAAGAGLLLRNISLNRQLRARADDVRESSRRLIAAQDAERLRLERDLHDGAQQQVVALKVKLGIARTVAEREGAEELATRVAALAEEAQHAVDQLRGVAHGIYPPLLEAEGLDVALRSVERSFPNGITIETPGLVRLPRHVEETAYFVVLDIVERARMSGASSVRVDVAATSGELVIKISHDGRTTKIDLTSVMDRVDALGGQTTIDTSSGETTHITSRLPTGELVMEPA